MFTSTTALLLSQDETTARLRLKYRRVVKTAFGGKLTLRVPSSSVSDDEKNTYMFMTYMTRGGSC